MLLGHGLLMTKYLHHSGTASSPAILHTFLHTFVADLLATMRNADGLQPFGC
jgi:hypothetical protein